jgi:hypothetical protein
LRPTPPTSNAKLEPPWAHRKVPTQMVGGTHAFGWNE